VVTIAGHIASRVQRVRRAVDAPFVRPGSKSRSWSRDPERRNKGKISRIGGRARLAHPHLLAEVDFDNGKGEFIAGSYVNVTLLIPPSVTSKCRRRRWWCATEELRRVVDGNNHVKLVPIEVAGTDGRVIRILNGLDEGVRLR